jgi:large subunit ribosomal protein L20
MSYSVFIDGLKKAGVEINRKMLSELAIHQPETLKQLIETARQAAPAPAGA